MLMAGISSARRMRRRCHLPRSSDLIGFPRSWLKAPAPSEQLDDFLVTGLAEVGIVKADGVERFWGREKNHLVAFGLKFADNGPRRHGCRKNEAARLISSDPSQGSLHSRAGRDPIVDDNRYAPLDVNRLGSVEMETPTALNLGEFTLLSRFEIATRRVNHVHDLLVDDNLRMEAVDDSAEGEFFVPWRADLAHQKKIQRRSEALSDLEADRDTAPRQS